MSERKPAICILTSQYFSWGIYGGFGSMSRKLAEHLAADGHPVSVIVPRRKGQPAIEQINGVTVRSFAPLDLREATRLIRSAPAEIFHSQDPTLLTFLAQRLRPRSKHLITCRDPRDWRDWLIEFWYATPRRRLLTPFNILTEGGPLIALAVRGADGVYCPAHFLKPKIQRMYGLRRRPELLPNLIDVPEAIPAKGDRPTITYIGRWDKRKRPWVFLDLARQFPAYRFIAVGKGSASAEADYDAELRRRYADVPNLEMPGLVNRFEQPERFAQILGDTWVLVNPAAREGLPLTFLEAAAYGGCILSAVDPDGFASRFGYQVQDDNFAEGLRRCLAGSPLERGQAGYAYVKATYENRQALAAHTDLYRSLA